MKKSEILGDGRFLFLCRNDFYTNVRDTGGCGHFSVPLGCKPEASSILIRAHPS